MATADEENPTKRPKTSHEEEEVVELEESEDGNLPQDIELENQLREAQADLDKIHDEMLIRLRQIEQEFEMKKAPFYKARGEVIKNIPGFWLHCFLQHQEIKLIIGDVDEQILSSLIEIAVEPQQESVDGYKLNFRFADNGWFEDSVLTKWVYFVTDPDTGSQSCNIKGSKPKWKKQDPTSSDESEKGGEAAPFVSWLVSEREFEPGHVDTLADIIKDQLFVNPLEYLEAENASENPDVSDRYQEGTNMDFEPLTGDEFEEGSAEEGKDDEPYGSEGDEEEEIDPGEAAEEADELLETENAGEDDEEGGEEEEDLDEQA